MSVLIAPLADTIATVNVTADLDVAALQQFWFELEEARERHPDQLIVDLSGCPHLGAQAIRLLLDELQLMRHDHGQLVLAGCRPEATRMLSMAGVLQLFALQK